VQSESSDAKSNNSPNESQAQVADLGENDGKKATKEIRWTDDLELHQVNCSSIPMLTETFSLFFISVFILSLFSLFFSLFFIFEETKSPIYFRIS
jgi:hypothetical protein